MEQLMTRAAALQAEKKLLFEQYEAITDKLAEAAELDAMDDYITKRGEMANKIDALDAEMKTLLTEAFGEEGGRALDRSVPRESLPQPLREVFDRNQDIQTVIRRVRLKNAQIASEVKQRQDETMGKIKNASNVPKINRYLSNLSRDGGANNFGSV